MTGEGVTNELLLCVEGQSRAAHLFPGGRGGLKGHTPSYCSPPSAKHQSGVRPHDPLPETALAPCHTENKMPAASPASEVLLPPALPCRLLLSLLLLRPFCFRYPVSLWCLEYTTLFSPCQDLCTCCSLCVKCSDLSSNTHTHFISMSFTPARPPGLKHHFLWDSLFDSPGQTSCHLSHSSCPSSS